jgi:excisionase family DNA binding protein
MTGASITLPSELCAVLADAARKLSTGQSVVVFGQDEELSTQEAADFLGMSRPHFIKLLKAQEIPYRLVGTHRRVKMVDVQKFQAHRDAQRQAALNQMTQRIAAEGHYDSDFSGDQ